jgi:predicted nucleic acid-binding Zn ribbon protein
VQPFQSFADGVIADALRRQPASPARTAFAWSVAVGPAIARATTVELRGTELVVTARDARWSKEIRRAADTILGRLQGLLGAGAVRTLRING